MSAPGRASGPVRAGTRTTPGQSADLPVEAKVLGETQRGEQGRTLCLEPGHRLITSRKAGHADTRSAGRGEVGADVVLYVSADQPLGGACGVDVVIHQAVSRGFQVRVAGLAEFACVGAQQVVA